MSSSAKKTTYTMDMTTGALLPKMLLFALPLMLSSILQLLFNAADLVVVSRFAGDNAMAAVGANGALINLMVNLFLGLSVGANVLAARERGAGMMEDLNRTVHTAMLLSVVGGVVLIFVGLVGAPMLLRWMQAPAEILDQAVLYLRIYFLGMPANMVYNFGAALLRSVGDTRRPLYYLSIAGVINVVLNLILVIVFHLDVAGVGIATVASQLVSAVLVVRCMMKDSGDIRLELRSLRIYGDKLKTILHVGLPAGLQGTLFSLSNTVIQSTVNGFGEIVVAGNAASANLEGFFYCAITATTQASLSFTSQNMGAGRRDRLPRIVLTASGILTVFMMGVAVVCNVWGADLLGIYSKTPEVVAAGLTRLLILGTTYALCGYMDILSGSLRGMGYAMMPMIVSLLGACGFRLLWVSTVMQIPAYHTIRVLFSAYPISWGLTGMVHLTCWLIVLRRMKAKYDS